MNITISLSEIKFGGGEGSDTRCNDLLTDFGECMFFLKSRE